MMDDRKAEAGVLPREMELLMFNSAGRKMAIDTAQVDCIMSLQQAEQQGISSFRLDEILGLATETSPASATVILLKNEVETYGLGVDRLDEITAVPIGTIQPIPELLSYFAGPRMFRGVVLLGNEVVLLIDLYRLKGLKPSNAALTA